MNIKLSKYYFNKCRKFAEAQLDTSKDCYKFRGEARQEKILIDIITGKLGEVAVEKYLRKLGYKTNKPDFNIYNKNKKSFSADLITECGLSVHVKAQSQNSLLNYGHSWLLQKSDKLIKSPNSKEVIVLVSVGDNLSASILASARAADIVEQNLLEEPVVPWFGRTKHALYLDSLKRANLNLNLLEEIYESSSN